MYRVHVIPRRKGEKSQKELEDGCPEYNRHDNVIDFIDPPMKLSFLPGS